MTPAHHDKNKNLWALAIGAIGVVYGDIGTSPLYAFREAAAQMAEESAPLVAGEVFGILSLILWALILIVTLKYVVLLLRIDNHGEGGTLALMALARSVIYRNTTFFLFLGIAGAGLFFGDAIITPAISVLSAVEGLKVLTPAFDPYVVPITIIIIVALFTFQSRGTAGVSKLFGPVTTLWFFMLGVTGLIHVIDHPEIFMAFNPYYALSFMTSHGMDSLLTLGAVFLAVTGAEALYADLGHFGRRPIQLAWGWFVFPCLVLNYLGQGALVLADPRAIENPFFNMVPRDWLLPYVCLATAATVIASQAVLTGAFSLARQAVNLGLLPRLVIKHTSADNSGQIYLPQINYILMVAVIMLVIVFKSSSGLASAYGISVTAAMVVDAIMAFFVIWQIRRWTLLATILTIVPFLLIETVFLGANVLKIFDGGWMPLTIAMLVITLMTTWIQGTFILSGRSRKRDVKLDRFIQEYNKKYKSLARVEGSAFFLTSDPNVVPASLLQNIRHNRILHRRNIILSIKVEPMPYVEAESRSVITHLNDDFSLVVLRFGFKDDIDVQTELIRMNRDQDSGIDFDWEKTSVFISRRHLRSHARYGMPLWQDWVYIFLNKHASEPTDFYKLPVGRVIEIGRHVVI